MQATLTETADRWGWETWLFEGRKVRTNGTAYAIYSRNGRQLDSNGPHYVRFVRAINAIRTARGRGEALMHVPTKAERQAWRK